MTSPREPGTGLPGHEHGRLVLLVCSANVCRSPMTQFLVEHEVRAVKPESPWTFLSAGTDARDGQPMCRSSGRAIARIPGGPAFTETHRSRPLTRELVEQASLVLTAAVQERSIVARLVPERRDRLFTMIEAARLAEVAS